MFGHDAAGQKPDGTVNSYQTHDDRLVFIADDMLMGWIEIGIGDAVDVEEHR